MSRKISIRRVVQTLVTLVAVSGCVLALVSADRVQAVRRLSAVQVDVRNTNAVHFISDDDVRQTLFGNRHIAPANISLAKLDVNKLESIARSNPWVSDAQVFVDNNRVLHILITQRIPVLRVFGKDGSSYYLDTALQSVPLSSQYVHYTTVFTGLPPMGNDSAGRAVKSRLVWLSGYIRKHSFWNAQIAEVAVGTDNTFELVPVMGRQRIIIGDTSRLDEKLDNLLQFYRQVQTKVGWDRYKILDLRYENQVVASPALPWKAPVDKALSNMSWVKAIMDAAPRDKNEADPDTVSNGLPGPVVAQQAVPQPAPAMNIQQHPDKPVKQAAKPGAKLKAAVKPSPKPEKTAHKQPKPKPKNKPVKPETSGHSH